MQHLYDFARNAMRRFMCGLITGTLTLLAAITAAAAQPAAQPATVRLDYIHSGNALSEQYAIERVLIEPLPWPGDMSQPFDDTNRGNNRMEVADAKTGAGSTNRCGSRSSSGK
jgi:hypothetical protein